MKNVTCRVSRGACLAGAWLLAAGCSTFDATPSSPPPMDAAVTAEPPTSCAVVLCAVGTTCIEVNGQAECREENPCNLVDCMPGAVCEVVDGEVVCRPAGR